MGVEGAARVWAFAPQTELPSTEVQLRVDELKHFKWGGRVEQSNFKL